MATTVPLVGLLVGVTLLFPGALAQATPAPCTPQQTEGCMPACPEGLAGLVQRDGNVFLSWSLLSSTDVNVYRSTDGGDFELVERLSFPTTRYVDHGVEPGHTYTYQVTAIGDYESPACGQVLLTSTSVPFFGGPIAAGLAALFGIVGYVVVARRRSRN